jgi:glutathione S-transferase
LWLLDELGAETDCAIQEVSIARQDGSGGPDPRNPHPEGKVPVLDHDGTLISESAAVVLYLTDLFPAAGLAPVVGDAARGSYLTWLAYYGGVMEPVLLLAFAGIEAPALQATFRGPREMTARLAEALEARPYLLGARFSAVDLLLSSPFSWFSDATPDVPAIRDWVVRCTERPAHLRMREHDQAAIF